MFESIEIGLRKYNGETNDYIDIDEKWIIKPVDLIPDLETFIEDYTLYKKAHIKVQTGFEGGPKQEDEIIDNRNFYHRVGSSLSFV